MKGPNGPVFDLEERTAVFGAAIIGFARKLPRNPVTLPLISQCVRAGTSIGANDCEADDAVSKKDFKTRSVLAARNPGKRNYGCG